MDSLKTLQNQETTRRPCRHRYELETVGGVYLTGAYVCQLCSERAAMTVEEFSRYASYPGHYQEDNTDLSADAATRLHGKAKR